MKKLKKLKGILKAWNIKSFGNIKQIKLSIQEQISALDSLEVGKTLRDQEIKERKSLRYSLMEIKGKEIVVPEK